MRVQSIRLRNFRRFTDLTISSIPAAAKLVVVVGPNGSGKSSLFDAFNHWHRFYSNLGIDGDEDYFLKVRNEKPRWRELVEVNLHDGASRRVDEYAREKKDSVYLRTAFRNDPDFDVREITRPSMPTEEVRIGKTTATDSVVASNYRRLVYETAAGVYDSANDTKSIKAFRNELIGDVQASMRNVFGDLILNSLSDPLGAGNFTFGKGAIASYHYKNLSGGERAAFDLLLDLHLKRKYYTDSIYCIDEVETHLHTGAQGAIIRELLSIVPDTSQLWITTHSIGVLRAAQRIAAETPGSVSIIDFDGVESDSVTEIIPSSLDRVSWTKLLSITLSDLSREISPKALVICEGSSVGKRRKDFDAEIYDQVLAARNPGIVFVSGGNSNQVTASGLTIKEAFSRILPVTKVVVLADRDSRSPREIQEFEATGGILLPVRHLEYYFFQDDVLEALVNNFGKSHQLSDAKQIREAALAASVLRGNPQDDFKSASGQITVGLRGLLGFTQGGNSSDAFMRDTLAPLIKPGMVTYEAMKAAIVDRIALPKA